MNRMNEQRGYIGLVMLVLGAGLGLWLLMYASPLRNAPGAQKSVGETGISGAYEIQGMADHRNGEIEAAMQQ